jgi:hypothetical protein
MRDKVVDLRLVQGGGLRMDIGEMLELAKKQEFVSLAIIGELPGGGLWLGGDVNAGEALILIEKAKHRIVFGKGDAGDRL